MAEVMGQRNDCETLIVVHKMHLSHNIIYIYLNIVNMDGEWVSWPTDTNRHCDMKFMNTAVFLYVSVQVTFFTTETQEVMCAYYSRLKLHSNLSVFSVG